MTANKPMHPPEATPQRLPWEQQPDETLKAFTAFRIYRDMGGDRSMSKVALKCRRSTRLVTGWSSKHRWVRRVEEYENYMDRISQKTRQKAIASMVQRHAVIASAMQEIVAHRIRNIDPDTLTVGELARLLQVAVKMEIESRKVPINSLLAEARIDPELVKLGDTGKSVKGKGSEPKEPDAIADATATWEEAERRAKAGEPLDDALPSLDDDDDNEDWGALPDEIPDEADDDADGEADDDAEADADGDAPLETDDVDAGAEDEDEEGEDDDGCLAEAPTDNAPATATPATLTARS